MNTSGDLYVINFNSIADPSNKRLKRLFDIWVSLVLIISLPLSIWFYFPQALRLIRNGLQVLAGKKTWVGYYPVDDPEMRLLPVIREGILHPAKMKNPNDNNDSNYNSDQPDGGVRLEKNLSYAKDYSLTRDLSLILQNLRFINS